MNNREDMDCHEELEKISPYLATLEKENTFSVPEGYFNELKEKLEGQMLPVESSFRVPDGYFEAAKDDIMRKISSNGENPAKGRSTAFKVVWLSVSAAAAAALAAVVILNTPENSGPASSSALLTDISTEEITTYLTNNVSELDQYILMDQVSEDDYNIFIMEEDLDEEMLDNYIMNNYNLEQIEEELL